MSAAFIAEGDKGMDLPRRCCGSHLLQVDKVGNCSPSSWSQARNRGRPLDIVARGVQSAMSSSPS
jgi:hypothetical protein